MSSSPFMTDTAALNAIFGVGLTSTSVTRNKTYIRRYAYHRADNSTGQAGTYYGNGDHGYQTDAGDYYAYNDGYSAWTTIYNRATVSMTLKTSGVPRGMRVRVIGNFGENTDDGGSTRITNNYGFSSEASWAPAVWSTNGSTVANFVDRQHSVDVDIPGSLLQAGVTFVFAARMGNGSGQEESWGIKSTSIQFLNWL